MIINASNGQVINSKDVYLHDDILESMIFRRDEKILHLSLVKTWPVEYEYSIDLFRVIGFEMTSCDFWGADLRILDFEYVSKGTLISKLFIQRKENYSYCPLKEQKDYIETMLTFVSGDTLRIACEEIIIEEKSI